MKVIDPISIELDTKELLKTLKGGRLRETDIAPIMEECRRLIEPKTVYSFSKVIGIEKADVQLESGHTLNSVLLADILKVNQVIALYVVTIGPRLEKQASEEAKSSLLQAAIMEWIADYALEKAAAYIGSFVKKTLGSEVYHFRPGEGTPNLFDIKQQKILFQIIDPTTTIGVSLTPGFMMVPRKSISGVLAATPQEYIACQYCPKRCENRKKPFSGEYLPQFCENEVH
jgi:hypothetical protein